MPANNASAMNKRRNLVLTKRIASVLRSHFYTSPNGNATCYSHQKLPSRGSFVVAPVKPASRPAVPMAPTPGSLAASLSAQQSALHSGPIVQAPSADFDIRQDSLCFPVTQGPPADWQSRQQLLFVNGSGLFGNGSFQT